MKISLALKSAWILASALDFNRKTCPPGETIAASDINLIEKERKRA